MSSLPHVDGAMPRTVLPEVASARSGADSQGGEFGVVMRAVFSPAPVPRSAMHPSATISTSSPRQSNPSQADSVNSASGLGENASPDAAPNTIQATQVCNDHPQVLGADAADETAPPSSETSSRDSIRSGEASTLKQASAAASAPAEKNLNQSKITPAKHSAGNVSSLATSLAAAAPNKVQSSAPVTQALGLTSVSKGTTGGATIASQPNGRAIASKNSFAPAVSAHTPQMDTADAAGATLHPSFAESAKANPILADGIGVAVRGTANVPPSASAQETQAAHTGPGSDATPKAMWNSGRAPAVNSASSANQFVDAAGNAGGNQAAEQAQDSPANGFTDPIVKARTSSGASTDSLDSAGNNGNSASNGNGPSTSIINGKSTSGSTATIFSPITATAKGNTGVATPAIPPGIGTAHETAAGSGINISNTSSVFSGASHSNTTQNPEISNVGLATSHGTPSDAFSALDSAGTGERGVLLHAAPHQIAVGITDPSLGWVEVRAERIAGQIAATLSTNSTASHAALTSVLPTMATYLQDHHTGVQQVHVETGLGGGQQGAGSQGQPFSQNDAPGSTDNASIVNPAVNGWAVAPLGGGLVPTQGTGSIMEGHHFSIRA